MAAPRKPITDPIEWIKDAIERDDAESGPERLVSLTNDQRLDAKNILQIAEIQRLSILSSEELSHELLTRNSMAVREEVAKRLNRPDPVAHIQPASGILRSSVPDGYHLMTGNGLPAGGVPCNCIHGTDHGDEFFEVPPGQPARVMTDSFPETTEPASAPEKQE